MPKPASEFFSARAKTLLDIEMDSPNVATVQALVVMSASEAAYTRDARGWLYSGRLRFFPVPLSSRLNNFLGMAARLSADLGLYMDVAKSKSSRFLNQRELEIRQTTFWGVFIHEK